ncbi:hypothetical protein LJC62_02855 [Odoribacter sp. OttesenSCG-928-A06]|nr:hypothetical protein [Odoribacter sp. OttesenSCG-928-A06]
MITFLKNILWVLLIVLTTACHKDNEEVIPPEPPAPPVEVPNVDDTTVFTFTASKKAVLFDITDREYDYRDEERQLYSARHMMNVAGLPYIESRTFSDILANSLVLISSPIGEKTFTDEEVEALIAWVEEGGVIISPYCKHQEMSDLFGGEGSGYQKTRYAMSWIEGDYPELSYFNAPNEKTISLGNAEYDGVKTYAYSLKEGGVAMAHFSTGEPAVVKKETGKGKTYLFGLEWRDVIQRPQMNKDFNAQRIYSNGFEPSADVFPLFLRSVWNSINEVSAWKHTIPEGYETVLLPTHDIDSRTGYDSMFYMSDYEKGLKFKAHFFMTTHFHRDGINGIYYDKSSVKNALKVKANGHTIGSHSTNHLPDFNIASRFPKGDASVTKDNYQPLHNTETGITSGGTTYGEIYLSKVLLDNDLGLNIRAFRPGHLCMNKYVAEVLDESKFNLSSIYSACDVLTAFPYYLRKGNDWTQELTSVLEIPMHISDVFNGFINETTYPEVVEIWKSIIPELANNYAPCVLLIHPNRKWKMEALKLFVESFDRTKYGLFNFEEYGDFWAARSKFAFDFSYDEATSIFAIKASKKLIEKSSSVSIVVESDKAVKGFFLIDEDNNRYPITVKPLTSTRTVVTIF